MLKTSFVGILDPFKSGVDQSLIANRFYLFQVDMLTAFSDFKRIPPTDIDRGKNEKNCSH